MRSYLQAESSTQTDMVSSGPLACREGGGSITVWPHVHHGTQATTLILWGSRWSNYLQHCSALHCIVSLCLCLSLCLSLSVSLCLYLLALPDKYLPTGSVLTADTATVGR